MAADNAPSAPAKKRARPAKTKTKVKSTKVNTQVPANKETAQAEGTAAGPASSRVPATGDVTEGPDGDFEDDKTGTRWAKPEILKLLESILGPNPVTPFTKFEKHPDRYAKKV